MPEDFGLLGMAVVFIGLISVLNDMGISSAIVQKRELSEKQLSSIFWFNLLIGFLAMFILILISPLIARFYNQNSLVLIISLMSLSFLFTSLSTVQSSLFVKNLKFKKLSMFELTSTISASILGISLAYLGYGVWSLVWQNLSTTLIYAVLVWIFECWKPKIYFDLNDIKPILSFSLNLSGFNLLNYLSRNADNLLIGKFLGANALGYYSLAYSMMLLPLSNVSAVLSKVMFPALSHIQHDNNQFKLLYLKSTKYIAFVCFPIMLFLLATVDEFILTIFSINWVPAIFLIKILSIVGLIQSIGSTVGPIYLAKGKTDWIFRWGIFSSIITISAISVGLRWGINGVSICYMIASLLLAYPSFIIPFRLIELRFMDMVLNIKEEIITSLIMFLFIILLVTIERYYSLPYEIIFLSSITIGLISYVLSVKALNNSTYTELKNHLFSGGK